MSLASTGSAFIAPNNLNFYNLHFIKISNQLGNIKISKFNARNMKGYLRFVLIDNSYIIAFA